MAQRKKVVNITLGGGGVKGLAYIGVFSAMEKKGFIPGYIAGVSAGALAGAFAAAGYNAAELREIVGSFEFGSMDIGSITKKVPAIARYSEFARKLSLNRSEKQNYSKDIELFLSSRSITSISMNESEFSDLDSYRGNILKNTVTYSKEGCLFDGDYLEEWVSKVLLKRGIRTFADLRTISSDSVNPGGYRVRMTAVDANRGRVIVLPDDMVFYGMDPDRLEVAKAVRMSTSVPFAFKPVELFKAEGSKIKTYNIVDGGVLDNLPYWLISNSKAIPSAGFELKGSDAGKLFSLDTPLSILKAFIMFVHDIGIPKKNFRLKYLAKIDTGSISFLDFNLDEQQKDFLFNSGKFSANMLFKKMNYDMYRKNYGIFAFLSRLFGMNRD